VFDVGKWINFKFGDSDFKYKILSYKSDESVDWYPYSEGNYIIDLEKVAHVNDITGHEDWLDEKYFEDREWEYIEDPTEEELFKAKSERKNNMLGYKCNYCDATDRNLLKCSGCNEVRYCNQGCQLKDWQNHKKNCQKIKYVLKPNPRYPMIEIKRSTAKAQKIKQDLLNKVSENAFTGDFMTQIDGHVKLNPKATDLEVGERYCLVAIANKKHLYQFKQRALDGEGHSGSSPSSCSLYFAMEMLFDDDQGFKNSGLHYLVDYADDPNMFWGMALNFNTFGTVAPFNPNCHCNYPKMPPKYKKLQKQWDKMFSRAKADINDVQCMFADTTEGCHSFGLPGDL
jgi:hypothetical protein